MKLARSLAPGTMPDWIDPRRNRLLAALPEDAWLTWKPWLEPCTMAPGDVLHEPGDRLHYVYFPITSTVSIQNMLASGVGTQVAVVGFEGLVGVGAFLGGGSVNRHPVVQSAGAAVRIDADLARGEFERGGPAADVMLRYANALMTQMAQTAVCNRHHSPEQQLCRWLLLSLDRVEGNELVTTHELIASMLGVRRETVSGAIRKLQRRGFLRYSRGHIVVLDREGLERSVCECYEVVRQEYERLLVPS
jgi:CRP-like cAMP-binding protein